MKLLDKLTSSPLQRYVVVTEEGDQFGFLLRYLPSQQSWSLSISWGEFVLNGISLVLSPNLLYGYSNILPFGLMVTATNSLDPSYIDDFTTGRIKIYVLSQADIIEQERIISA